MALGYDRDGDGIPDPPGPMEKYDNYCENNGMGNPGAKDWEVDNHYDPNAPSWFGHCQGWSAASIMEPEPFMTSINCSGVGFAVGDQKGLLTELHCDDLGCMWGNVYNGTGNPDDVDPYMFHGVLIDWIGTQRKPVVMDTERLVPVANYTAYRYVMDAQIDPYDETKLNVTCTVWFADDGVHPDFVGTQVLLKNYTYYLTIENGYVVPGPNAWTGDSVTNHPDNIWHPEVRNAETCSPTRLRYIKRNLLAPYRILAHGGP